MKLAKNTTGSMYRNFQTMMFWLGEARARNRKDRTNVECNVSDMQNARIYLEHLCATYNRNAAKMEKEKGLKRGSLQMRKPTRY